MDPNILSIIISALAGLVAGHGTGAAGQTMSLGPIGNTVTGAIGGVGGGLIGALIPALQQIGTSGINGSSVGGGAIGGIILTAIVGMLRNNVGNPQP